MCSCRMTLVTLDGRSGGEAIDLLLAPDEIVDAGWYRRGNLPELPPPLAIARRIIENWRDES